MSENKAVCNTCKASAPKPPDTQWKPLWDAGWRWIGSQDLHSCPDCPPVVIVTADSRHVRP